MTLDFSVVPPYWQLLLAGLCWTILITIIAVAISFTLGIGIALLIRHGHRAVAVGLHALSFLFMGTPLLLQLYLLYYGLAQVGILLPAFWTGVVGLGIHYAVYNSNIVGASLDALDTGQGEAARALGFGRLATLRHFIVPQAVLTALPQIGSNSIILLKDTAVLSVLGIAELVLDAQRAISETYRPLEFYLVAAILYYLVNIVMERFLFVAAKRVEAFR